MKYREFEELTNEKNKPILVDFHSDWCAPCRVLEPIIDDVASYYGKELTVLRLNTDENPEITNRLNIFSVPTLLLYKTGKIKWRVTGVRSAKDIKKQVDKLLGIKREPDSNEQDGFLKSILKKITE